MHLLDAKTLIASGWLQREMKLLSFDTGRPALLRTGAERRRHITLHKP